MTTSLLTMTDTYPIGAAHVAAEDARDAAIVYGRDVGVTPLDAIRRVLDELDAPSVYDGVVADLGMDPLARTS